ncbi:MAG: cation diffusion facilitator family transporter [Clostridia bacterium]|jgi:cation diffusion facilitator family transporter|nr:cation diffusion facilitator family transporter [Clostridia bacterium]
MVMKINKKQRAAALSIVSNTGLIVLKAVAGIMSGSISILSEAIHSGMDLIAALISYLSVTFSGKPADEEHPYGHGKIENISGVVEGLLIFLAAALIIKEATEKILHPEPVKMTFLAVGVMFFSALVNTFVSRVLYKTAREEDSIALEADALHLKTDVYTSLGVGVGLILMNITNIQILDPLVAIIVALFIIKEAWHLCRNAFNPLLDVRLEEKEEQAILHILERCKQREGVEAGHLRTRKSGPQRLIDFHLYFAPETTIGKGCQVAESIRQEVSILFPNVHIHINIETLDKYHEESAYE